MTQHHSRRRLTRIATLGATGALLATAGLGSAPGAGAAAPSAPATIAARTSTLGTDAIRYRCTGPMGLTKVTVGIDVGNLADGDPTKMLMSGGLEVDVEVDFPVAMFSGLFGGLFGGVLGSLGGFAGTGQIDGLSLSLGTKKLPLGDVVGDVTRVRSDPRMDTEERTPALTLPSPGTYDLTLPDTFSFSPLSLLGLDLFTVSCEAVEDPVVDEVVVDEQESDVDTDVIETPAGDPAVVTDVTTELGQDATGTVEVVSSGHTVARSTLRKGKAVLPLRSLGKGRHTVKVRYLGNRLTKPSARTVRLSR